ncbi:transcriptional repressor LexA [Candidatus Parcubacteria bacterium]|nr:MAG: transcriptional repressor LexA [Candidatus Parcubacteria bacterium]
MEKPTKKQKEIVDFIAVYIKEQGISPSYLEIGRHFNLSSPATVHQHVQALKDKGYLKGGFNEKRSIEVTPKVMRLANALNLPLVGLIAAGEPIEAIENNEAIGVPADLVADAANSYVLQVKGRSMIDEGILDGDYVIVERNPSPRNGDVVVALLDNAYATLKKFYREKDKIRLQPANSQMKPIFAKDPLIQGIVKAVIRKYKTI